MPRDLEPGTALGPRTVCAVDAGPMAVMTAILDDPNPIHLEASAVQALGLGGRRINQGPINLGYVVDMLAEEVPTAAIERIEVRFLANVFEGDDVVATGVVRDSGEDRMVRCTLRLDRAPGGPVLTGTAVLRRDDAVDDHTDAS